MTKAIEKAYNKYDDRNEASTPQTLKAEKKFSETHKKIAKLDEALAFELDVIVGELARAYEKQGFEAGYKAAVKTN